MSRRVLLCVFFAFAFSSVVQSAIILKNDFDGSTTDDQDYFVGQVTADGITEVNSGGIQQTFVTRNGYDSVAGTDALVVKGLGPSMGTTPGDVNIQLVPSTFAATYGQSTAQSNLVSSSALRNEDYFQFQIEIESGYAVNFDSFEFSGTLINGTPGSPAESPNIIEFHRGFDTSANANIAVTPIPVTGVGSGTGADAILLAADEFQNVTGSIQFRLYVQDSRPNYDDLANCYALESFAFNGAVTAVPEPTSAVLLMFACVACLFRRQRQPRR
ncbi:PEP-CTERM sorting domain-containing protein [Planctomycetes bacterium K23_9]|uniref:PEP-CTERM protein-sorting domain-containing protein n=1 Tax=Stieleria marina TaxID=1930275 RepID=A0A517NW65_9BACT|nr:hypothetical protein K239x_33590 [Planctomycetes bacterium K23_9]